MHCRGHNALKQACNLKRTQTTVPNKLRPTWSFTCLAENVLAHVLDTQPAACHVAVDGSLLLAVCRRQGGARLPLSTVPSCWPAGNPIMMKRGRVEGTFIQTVLHLLSQSTMQSATVAASWALPYPPHLDVHGSGILQAALSVSKTSLSLALVMTC